jgi:hypothetical protein
MDRFQEYLRNMLTDFQSQQSHWEQVQIDYPNYDGERRANEMKSRSVILSNILDEYVSFQGVREKKKTRILKWEKIKEDNNVYTIKDFHHACQSHFFVDGDGFGNLAKDGLVSNKLVYPSDAMNWNIPEGFTHVVWYNK